MNWCKMRECNRLSVYLPVTTNTVLGFEGTLRHFLGRNYLLNLWDVTTHDTWLLPRNYIVTLVSLGTSDTKESDKNCKINPPTSEQFFY